MQKSKKELEIENCCGVCEKSRAVAGENMFVCSKHGLVKPEAVCKSFLLDPMKLKPRILYPKESFSPLELEVL